MSMNVMKTLMAVVRYAPTLKEAMNAPAIMVMHLIVIDIIAQVHIFDHG